VACESWGGCGRPRAKAQEVGLLLPRCLSLRLTQRCAPHCGVRTRFCSVSRAWLVSRARFGPNGEPGAEVRLMLSAPRRCDPSHSRHRVRGHSARQLRRFAYAQLAARAIGRASSRRTSALTRHMKRVCTRAFLVTWREPDPTTEPDSVSESDSSLDQRRHPLSCDEVGSLGERSGIRGLRPPARELALAGGGQLRMRRERSWTMKGSTTRPARIRAGRF
jgi:hypothetical protein